MDNIEVEPVSPDIEINSDHPRQNNEQESVENFEKFIYELFEKNGILSDLRAYLRRHIVNLLKSAQIGETPACQRHFAQRLELTTQAMNMLVAEYLLRLEFSYTLSVFVSEIPLANMVFDFASSMMRGDGEDPNLRFKEKDVCSILNYLGIKCDAEHVADVIEMYKNSDHTPLLVCILKNMTMYQPNAPLIDETISEGSVSSTHSSDTLSESPRKKKSPTFLDKCRHYNVCRTCHNKLAHLRDKYKRRKRDFIKKETSINSINVKAVMKNISAIEGTLTDEMMEQVKSVYEAEIELVRAEEERKVKRSIASHAIQLQQQKQELEETFKAREEELEKNVRAKKKFLWGLARSLRDQHEQMTRAMNVLRCHTRRLTAKEDSLKSQLVEAEQVLRHRGESIRAQISGELLALEGQLDTIKKERDCIHQERSELEQMKMHQGGSNTTLQQHDKDTSNEMRSFYELKNELANLKKYMEATRLDPKVLIDRCTITDLHGVSSKLSTEILNNEQDIRAAREEDRLKANQLINDFKKQKNVNFNMITPGEESSSAEGLPLSVSSPAATILQLRHENERLRQYASQQQVQLEQLAAAAARLQTSTAREAWRPRTAPETAPPTLYSAGFNVNPTVSTNSFGWRKGAGEELCAVGGPGVRGSRVLLPGDNLPFIGVLRDRHADTRRHIISQWRAMRRLSPPPRRPRPPSPAQRDTRPNSAGPSVTVEPMEQLLNDNEPESDQPEPELLIIETRNMEKSQSSKQPRELLSVVPTRNREKSPKSMLREAKEKLRTKANIKYSVPSTSSREKSPSSVLREAKMRLRKLEIEAEAVEKSYLDFRKRQSELRGERAPVTHEEDTVTKDTGDLSIRRSRSLQKIDQNYNTDAQMNRADIQKMIRDDFDRYLRTYHAKFDLSDTHFHRNLNTAKAKPIPEAFSSSRNLNATEKICDDINNYLDTPITEFRQYYRAQIASSNQRVVGNEVSRPMSPKRNETRPRSPLCREITTVETDKDGNHEEKNLVAKKEALLIAKNCKQMELEILKCNINKMYNIPDSSYTEVPPNVTKNEESQANITLKKDTTKILMIEVENVNKTDEINVVDKDKPPNLLVEVQSRVEAVGNPHSDSEPEGGEKMCGNMTILISPKRSDSEETATNRAKSPENGRRSISPEQAARLTRNDVFEAIFHADTLKATSSFEMHPISSKDHVDDLSEVEKDATEDYPDDFSADVDNYNTLSDKNSPISLPKSPTDDRDFWDN